MNQRDAPLGLFGLVAISVFELMAVVATIYISVSMCMLCVDYARMRNAVVVDVEIHKVERELKTAGDGVKEVVHVTYSYQFDGKEYRHRTQKLALFYLDEKTGGKINEAFKNGGTTPCFVDPDHPQRSLFSRDFSISTFLVLGLFPLFFWQRGRDDRHRTDEKSERGHADRLACVPANEDSSI